MRLGFHKRGTRADWAGQDGQEPHEHPPTEPARALLLSAHALGACLAALGCSAAGLLSTAPRPRGRLDAHAVMGDIAELLL